MNYETKIKFTMLEKIVGLATFIVFGLPILGSLIIAFIVLLVFSPVIFCDIFVDQHEVSDSHHLGKKVSIAPIATIAKLKDFGGWRDKYLYILTEKPNENLIWSKRVEQYLDLKVVKVLKQSSGFPVSTDHICVLENQDKKEELYSEECSELTAMSDVTEIFKTAERDILNSGSAFLAIQKQSPIPHIKLVYEVNNYQIYILHSKNEIESLLKYEESSFSSYYHLMSKLPITIKGDELNNEYVLSQLFPYSIFTSWNSVIYPDEKLKEFVKKRRIPINIEKWIIEQAPESEIDRWALRVLASTLQTISLSYPNEDMIKEGYQKIIECLLQYTINKEAFLKQQEALLNLFLSSAKEKINLSFLIKQEKNKTPSTAQEFFSCRLFSPPQKI